MASVDDAPQHHENGPEELSASAPKLGQSLRVNQRTERLKKAQERGLQDGDYLLGVSRQQLSELLRTGFLRDTPVPTDFQPEDHDVALNRDLQNQSRLAFSQSFCYHLVEGVINQDPAHFEC